MGYNTENLKSARGGKTPETSDNKVTPKAGVYRHPEAGTEVITQGDPLHGDIQSEAAVRLGFVRVRDAKPGEVKTVIDTNREARKKKEVTQAAPSADAQRLDTLELESLRREKKERDTAVQEAVKTEAAMRVGAKQPEPVVEQPEKVTKVKSKGKGK
mgnify:CR=1 FL=1